MPNTVRLLKKFCACGANGRLDLSLSWRACEDQLKDHTRYDQGPEIHEAKESVVLVGEAQLAGCLKIGISDPFEWDAGIQ